MISRFFIQRPVFAAVISILLTLGGLVALKELPIEQYPNITPPQIQITVSYPGASANTIADTVAAPLEDQINGVEDMIYMYSESSSAGALTLDVFFEIGSDADKALNNVQDRVDLAMPQLPESVQKQGVTVKKETPTILLIVAVQSPDGRYDEVFTSNYATIHVADEILRLPGVSDAKLINARDYAMRVWLRPDEMAQLGITSVDVIQAISNQNADYPIGQLGQAPTHQPVLLDIPVVGLGRLNEPKQYEDIILRATSDGSSVLIKDIGAVELGAQDYSVIGEINGKSTALIAVYQEYGANALDVAAEVKRTLDKLFKRFPPGLTYSIPYDTTTFIKISIKEVEKTLYEAAILVALVVFIFLQSMRATIIPILAMVVSIIGTFAGMHLLGFSLNTLTLFGLVLAIGIVVDDAIVVVENVERNMREKGLKAKEAALLAMEEVSGPVIAIVFVLCAVFIPVAFLGGIAGELYRQFAITIAISVIFSGIIALTLSPVLASLLFKQHTKPSKAADLFNRFLQSCTNKYGSVAAWLIDRPFLGLLGFAIVALAVLMLAKTTPTSFVPQEDQGYLFAFAMLPDAASLDRTEEVTQKVEKIVHQQPGVDKFVSMTGFSLLENLNRTQVGTYFIILKDWKERTKKSLSADGILASLSKQFYGIPQALVMPFNPPAIQGLGTVGGFEFWIVNEGDADANGLQAMTDKFLTAARKRPELSPQLSAAINANCIQLYADVDRTKVRAYKVSIGDVYQTLATLLGSVYVNNFNKYGHVFQVMVQAEPEYRTSLQDIGNMYVKSENGDMVPIKALVNFYYTTGENLVSRFNNFPAVKINGSPAEGFTSGQAMKAMEEIADELLPYDMSYAWSGQAYQEEETGGSSISVLIAALVLVFLILAALYERWSLPLAILLVVPFGILGAFVAIWLRHLSNDVYFQIGLVTLIALAAKNAILIVEFAIQRRKDGLPPREAALQAAKQRFRAIIMTSLTFVFGVLPLVTSTGAGAASRHSVGTGVMGGMLFATFLGIFFMPLFYKILDRQKKPPQNQ
ncbi:MAG: multidrug efflux RND transporter permease subunit [Verrucomicrobia bacterium]|nr:multidrug efflux RND transporter permease subunit [Verrucomicrobiota bacterium]MBS0645628.1 multidrug efflux RND transporter permease subunit [Verrucomicrobiota bacterium]